MIGNRRAYRLAVLLVSMPTLGACEILIAQFVLPREGVREPQYPVRIERNVTLTTSDNVGLIADVYRPSQPPLRNPLASASQGWHFKACQHE